MFNSASCLEAPAVPLPVHKLLSELLAEGFPTAGDKPEKGSNLADCSMACYYLLLQFVKPEVVAPQIYLIVNIIDNHISHITKADISSI